MAEERKERREEGKKRRTKSLVFWYKRTDKVGEKNPMGGQLEVRNPGG